MICNDNCCAEYFWSTFSRKRKYGVVSLMVQKGLARLHRGDGEKPRKWVVYVGIICAILMIFSCFYLYLFEYADVDSYLADNKDIINLYNFYDKKVGEKETAVFFIGSSIVGESIYPTAINEHLSDSGYEIKTYSLFVNSDIPLGRALEIQKIIDAKPSLVIYGVTYRTVTAELDKARTAERLSLVWSQLKIRDDCLYLFTDDEKNDLFHPPSIFYYKTFIDSAKKYKSEKNTLMTSKIGYDYSKDTISLEYREYLSTLKNDAEIRKQTDNPNDPWRPVVTNEKTRYKEALLYNIRTLHNAGIPVVIVNMPLHPLLSEKITNESRNNFFTLLNETGVSWYDMEQDYGEEFFYDTHHATLDGAKKFAPVLAKLIIKELT